VGLTVSSTFTGSTGTLECAKLSCMPEQRKQIDWTAVRAMAESGMPLREIARRLGIPSGTVLARSSREHWNISAILGKGRKAQTSKAQLVVTNQTLQAGRDYFRDASALSRANQASACLTASEYFAAMNGSQLEQSAQPWSASVKNSERVFAWNQQSEQEKERIAELHLKVLQLEPRHMFFAQLLYVEGKFQTDNDEQAYWNNPQEYFSSLPPHEQQRLNLAWIDETQQKVNSRNDSQSD
jgi:hypothetical protein